MHRDHAACVRAVRTRDARYDGQFITGVTSTGIYCRPSCPARTPSPTNMRFYPTAAAAHRDGFRACKRCLPDASPGSPEWNVRADVAARAVRLIRDGLLDRAGVPELAASLGYSPRHLERVMRAEIGTGPLGLARAQRAQTARTLIERTRLPLSEIAWASGFGSIRTFNEVVQAVYGASPRQLRARAETTGQGTGGGVSTRVTGLASAHTTSESSSSFSTGGLLSVREQPGAPGYTEVPVRLPFRPPIEPRQLFGHLVATAVPGVEEWTGDAYRRTLRLPHGHGILAVHLPSLDGRRADARHLDGTLHLADLRDLTAGVQRARWLLDLDADPLRIDAVLASDPLLEPLVAGAPGRRIPRTVDPDELAIRIVLGQQVSTAAARTVTGRLVAALGEKIEDPEGGLTHLFPGPSAWAGAGDDVLRLPMTRARAVRALAGALEEGLDLGPGADWAVAREALAGIPGIGAWTVEGIVMRALGDPDAFVATDLGVGRAATGLGIATPRALADRAERWRPWRAYAVQHLWATGTHPINDLPDPRPPLGSEEIS
ncbi:MAG: DNA-3-methyladenine glycosylase 2 family protein [Actinomycetales bacterium]|nr:DNA-3-methyladenine glycosylase 2 family protein [Actinomycetales bacterium]